MMTVPKLLEGSGIINAENGMSHRRNRSVEDEGTC